MFVFLDPCNLISSIKIHHISKMDETISSLESLLEKLKIERTYKNILDAIPKCHEDEDSKNIILENFSLLSFDKSMIVIQKIWETGNVDIRFLIKQLFDGNILIYKLIGENEKIFSQDLIDYIKRFNYEDEIIHKHIYPRDISFEEFKNCFNGQKDSPRTRAVYAIVRGFDYFTRLEALDHVMKKYYNTPVFFHLKKKYTLNEKAFAYKKKFSCDVSIEMFDDDHVILREEDEKDSVGTNITHFLEQKCHEAFGKHELLRIVPSQNIGNYTILWKITL